jgi:hypothetical protein
MTLDQAFHRKRWLGVEILPIVPKSLKSSHFFEQVMPEGVEAIAPSPISSICPWALIANAVASIGIAAILVSGVILAIDRKSDQARSGTTTGIGFSGTPPRPVATKLLSFLVEQLVAIF